MKSYGPHESDAYDTPEPRHVESCWLPTEWQQLWFVDATDHTAIEVGDIIFNPEGCAHYAGEVTRTFDWGLDVRWRKTEYDTFSAYVTWSQLFDMWWADPCIQDAGKCACGSTDCKGDCDEN